MKLFTQEAIEVLGKFLFENTNIHYVEIFASTNLIEALGDSNLAVHNVYRIFKYLKNRNAPLNHLYLKLNTQKEGSLDKLNELLVANTFIDNLTIDALVY